MMKSKSLLVSNRKRPFHFFITFVVLFSIHCLYPASVTLAKTPKDKERIVPASLIKWPKKGSDYAVLVDKSKQKVLIYHRNNPFKPVKTYRATTGENGGPKTRQNDKRTPEGIYFFVKELDDRQLAPIYGVRAFPLNYPNLVDKRAGRGGYGIWFHGLDRPLKPNDTRGCIALENHNIDDLADYITLHDTPVVISPTIRMTTFDKVQHEAKKLEQVIESWRRAWEQKEIDRYMAHYHPRFSSGSKNWRQWKNHKARLAKRYQDIRVEVDDLRLLRNDGTVLASFTQRYRAAGFKSVGQKRLFLQQNSEDWKIVGETFQLATRKKIKRVAPKKPRVASVKEIRDFIYQWKKSWEEKDLNSYISCYDSGFRSRGMGFAAWKAHRKRLNRKYLTIRVNITNLRVEQRSHRTARVRFKQDYLADGYRDFGLKKIRLEKKNGTWKIKEETWRRLKK